MTLVALQTSIPIETLRPLSSAFFLPIHTAYIERINKLPWLLLYLIKTGLFFRDQDKIYILFPPETETLPSGSPPPSQETLTKYLPEIEQYNPLTIFVHSSGHMYATQVK